MTNKNFLKISNNSKDVTNKDKLIKDFIENRKKLKNDFASNKIFESDLKDERIKFFEPISTSLFDHQEQIKNQQETSNQILQGIKTLKQPRLLPMTPNEVRRLQETPAIQKSIQQEPQLKALPEPLKPEVVAAKQPTIKVSNLISMYLSDNKDRSTAGYSIKHHPDKNRFSIGNRYIDINNNEMKISDKVYIATVGLMELLTKSNPNLGVCIEEDFENYKQIILDTNAIYKGFDRTNKIQAGPGVKYKLIRDRLLPELFNKTGTSGSGVETEFLPSNPDELINKLKLSIASYKAGNTGEFNRINAILDTLFNMEVLSISEYQSIIRGLN